MQTVEINLADGKLGFHMTRMRTWLDSRRFEPDSFRYELAMGASPLVRVEFKYEREAVAFAEAFDGRLIPNFMHSMDPKTAASI